MNQTVLIAGSALRRNPYPLLEVCVEWNRGSTCLCYEALCNASYNFSFSLELAVEKDREVSPNILRYAVEIVDWQNMGTKLTFGPEQRIVLGMKTLITHIEVEESCYINGGIASIPIHSSTRGCKM